MSRLIAFWRNQRAATAAEFAMVLPVALLLLLGTIDIGRYFWALNQLEKAVQAGTRHAVATDVVATGLNAEDYSGFACSGGTINPGDRICREALGRVTCAAGGGGVACSCDSTSGACPADSTSADVDAFNAIVGRMRVIDGAVNRGNVRVHYSGSGLGYAGDPNADDDGNPLSEIVPVVTVEVNSFRFRSISLLGAGITLPGFRYSQTLEDGDGAIAY